MLLIPAFSAITFASVSRTILIRYNKSSSILEYTSKVAYETIHLSNGNVVRRRNIHTRHL